MSDVTRRGVLGGIGAAAAGPAMASTSRHHHAAPHGQTGGAMFTHAAAPMARVRCAIIGAGERGTPMAQLLAELDGVEIVAVCDIDEFVLDRTLKNVTTLTGKTPARYTGDIHAYRHMLDRPDVDVVFVFTPWQWHAPMALDALNRGKHAFVEVPIATRIEDMWALVETSERTGLHCMMLENCCYGREELMVLNMVRQNVFGELLHGEAAYLHELKQQLSRRQRGEGVWRPFWQTRQRGNLYPTHGLGPVAQYMNINRGDRFDYAVSMDSPALGMAKYAREKLPEGDPARGWKFLTGDISSSLIKTVKGRTILVQHDIDSPRPYSRHNYILGTNGAFGGYPPRIALDAGGLSADHHKWDNAVDGYYAKYEHPLWAKLANQTSRDGSHGGMDFVMLWRLIYCLRNGLPVDQPVYDGAAWSALFELSDRSVRNRSAPQDFPDFTRGGWRHAASYGIRA